LFADHRLLAALAMVALSVAPTYSAGEGGCAEEPVKAAVRSAVETRLGRRVEVTLDDFTCALTTNPAQALAATPDPLARTGRSVRFAITTAAVGPRGYAIRLGSASAVVRVSGPHVRAARTLSPGGTIAADDLQIVTGTFDGLMLRRLPSQSDLVGARLMRGVREGEPIATDAVVIPPVVRSGDQVRLTVRQGGVEAAVTAVAEQTASIGQVIRVVNASSHRPLRARVTAPGEAEVVE
jgi:flagella basal body P-ring formation protein FlgA